MKKLLMLFLALSLMFLPVLGYAEDQVRVASLKGPTTMGMSKMMQDDAAHGAYDFKVAGTADEIVPLLVKGELDIALIPCNLASVLYNKTQGAVGASAINTLGVLYILSTNEEVQSISDLVGKTLYSTGKGTTPEYALNAVLRAKGIDPGKDLTIEYKAEATEVASALSAGQTNLAMLPQPYVTAVCAQNPEFKVVLSLTECWEEAMPDSALITGVVLMRKAFLEEQPGKAAAFMQAYRASTDYVNAHPEEVAPWIEKLGIAKAAIAEKAIPQCNIVCIEGTEMQDKISGYLTALYAQEPASVGGSLPGEDFYLTLS